MNVMEKLREAVLELAPEEVEPWTLRGDEVLAAIDAFAAAHPHIVDLTVCGPQCPAWTKFEDCTEFCECDDRIAPYYAPTGSPCPVMEGRK